MTFFSIEDIQNVFVQNLKALGIGTVYQGSNISMPRMEVILELSDIKRTYERQAYTFMTLIGDIGGFNSAIYILPAYLMAWYSERMYQSSVYQELPVKKKNRRSKSYNLL